MIRFAEGSILMRNLTGSPDENPTALTAISTSIKIGIQMASKKNKSKEFSELAQQKRSSIIAEFWGFLKYNKKWWLIPILIVLLVLCLLVLLGGTAIAPFIYPLF